MGFPPFVPWSHSIHKSSHLSRRRSAAHPETMRQKDCHNHWEQYSIPLPLANESTAHVSSTVCSEIGKNIVWRLGKKSGRRVERKHRYVGHSSRWPFRN